MVNTYRNLIREKSKQSLFKVEFEKFKNLSLQQNPRFEISWENVFPCLNDKTNLTDFDRHYIYHTAWAARVLKEINPTYHIDISSILYFCSIISAFIPVKFYDYRPADLHLSNLNSDRADLLSLPFENNSIESLSCMHTIEHIGLGRYGDELDPEGDLKGIRELQRVLAKNGNLLFVVPIGKPKIIFNAHRVYSYSQIMSYFSDLALVEFSLIPQNAKNGHLIRNANKELVDLENYACGCFWFRK